MRHDDSPGDKQAQSDARGAAFGRRRTAPAARTSTLDRGRNRPAGIVDTQHHLVARGPGHNIHACAVTMLDRVAHQIGDHLRQPIRIPFPAQIAFSAAVQPGVRMKGLEFEDHILQQSA